MDNEYFLVKWIYENPTRFTVMQRSDISEDDDSRRPIAELNQAEIKFRWKKQICTGLIVATGML